MMEPGSGSPRKKKEYREPMIRSGSAPIRQSRRGRSQTSQWPPPFLAGYTDAYCRCGSISGIAHQGADMRSSDTSSKRKRKREMGGGPFKTSRHIQFLDCVSLSKGGAHYAARIFWGIKTGSNDRRPPPTAAAVFSSRWRIEKKKVLGHFHTRTSIRTTRSC